MTAFRGLLRIHTSGSLGLVKIACAINRQLPEFTSGSQFVTALYAVLNPLTEELSFVNCGHHPPLLVRPGGKVGMLKAHGPALGIIDRASYPSKKMTMKHGDILALFTDGVVELRDPAGAEFGRNGLIEAIHQHGDLPAAELVRQVVTTTREFSGSPRYPDDFTLVIIKRVD
jgi:sigma-B regulation protein RsbU (phosphoserine phosphatase)